MAYVVGIDQGGTKTIAIVSDGNGRILGCGYSRGACHSIQGMEPAMNCVRQAVSQAMEATDVRMDDVSIVYAGMTGADWPYEYDLLRSALRGLFPAQDVYVDNDCIIALRSGTDRPDAAVICAGTGLNAAVKSAEGEQYVYGYYINDEDAGGEALGRLAVKAVFNAESGLAAATLLSGRVLDYYRLDTVDELMKRYATRKLGEYKVLAPLLFQTALDGDAEADRIVGQFGARIARYATAGAARLGVADRQMDVVLTGSVFKNQCPAFHKAVEETIRSGLPHAGIVSPPYEPVVGALLCGLDLLHGKSFPLDSPLLAESVKRMKLLRYTE